MKWKELLRGMCVSHRNLLMDYVFRRINFFIKPSSAEEVEKHDCGVEKKLTSNCIIRWRDRTLYSTSWSHVKSVVYILIDYFYGNIIFKRKIKHFISERKFYRKILMIYYANIFIFHVKPENFYVKINGYGLNNFFQL